MITANVKIQKICRGALPQPVEQIAHRAPDDKPEGGGRETVVGLLDPDKEPHSYGERERHQDPNRSLAEQSEAYAGVVAEHEIKEVGDGDDPRWNHDIVQDQPFRRLIKEKSAKGDWKAEPENIA